MPFDIDPKFIETKPDLSVPSTPAITYALRHLAEVLPKHVWDFPTTHRKTACGSVGCAFGVARELWGAQWAEAFSSLVANDAVKNLLNPSYTQAREIYGVNFRDVTPLMVADAIDAYLASSKVP